MSRLDTEYFRQKLSLIARDLSHYTPQEMSRELVRLAKVADESEAAKEAAQQPDSERDAALEEAAKICESLYEYPWGEAGVDSNLREAAEAIRAAMAAQRTPPMQFVVMGDSESSPDPLLADMTENIMQQGEKGGAK